MIATSCLGNFSDVTMNAEIAFARISRPGVSKQPLVRAANVGSFPANPFGMHDMNGSVWEWEADC